LRLNIGILNFGQRVRPVDSKGQPQGRLTSYGNGSWGKGLACATGGTGSRPPRVKGWQRNNLQRARPVPRSGPCVAIAISAYSEQVGR
jgi:hypothetical protein